MAIHPLPKSTVRLLGSSQVLTTATSLVKELIDNALDAKAIAIDILISQNTIDKVEVRDNGHGVAKEDLDALGRRGHTSKLRAFEELRSLGGSSLGFRGEALASAVQLGNVTVTTRTDGEPVATFVKLKALGGIDSQSHASHPIGTTVCVLNFMSNLPVRKQVALREAPKTLAKLRDLVQAYALARHTVRFSLKIMKGGKGSWSFAPRPKGSIRDAISQVIGRDASSQLMEKCVRFSDTSSSKESLVISNDMEESPTGTNHTYYTVKAFMPKPDAELGKLGNSKFLTIDSRPVSCEKGSMKKIITIFKKYIRATASDSSAGNIKNTFIYLDMKCPTATYDPNVEPAKDDVLFSNEVRLLESIEALCKSVYGNASSALVKPSKSLLLEDKLDGFAVLLARKPVSEQTSMELQKPGSEESHTTTNHESQNRPDVAESTGVLGTATSSDEAFLGSEQPVGRRRNWGVNMSSNVGDDIEISGEPLIRPQPELSSDVPSSHPRLQLDSSVNPWAIAKLNAPVHPPHDADREALRGPLELSVGTPEEIDTTPSTRKRHEPVTPPQAQAWPQRNSGSTHKPLSESRIRRQRPHDNETFNGQVGEEPMLLNHEEGRSANAFMTARQLNTTSLLTPPATQISKGPKKLRGPNRPFVSPMRPPEPRQAADRLQQTKLSLELRPTEDPNAYVPHRPSQENAELAWAMEFEERKEAATRHRRAELRASRKENANQASEGAMHTSPHQARYEAAIANLESPQSVFHDVDESQPKVAEKAQTALPDGDPRAYLMRRQKSMLAHSGNTGAPPRLKRTRTTMLPLEKIPIVSQVHHLLQNCPVDVASIKASMKLLADLDLYVGRGSKAAELALSPTETSGIEKRLQEVVTAWISGDEQRKCEVEYTFGNLGKEGAGNRA